MDLRFHLEDNDDVFSARRIRQAAADLGLTVTDDADGGAFTVAVPDAATAYAFGLRCAGVPADNLRDDFVKS